MEKQKYRALAPKIAKVLGTQGQRQTVEFIFVFEDMTLKSEDLGRHVLVKQSKWFVVKGTPHLPGDRDSLLFGDYTD